METSSPQAFIVVIIGGEEPSFSSTTTIIAIAFTKPTINTKQQLIVTFFTGAKLYSIGKHFTSTCSTGVAIIKFLDAFNINQHNSAIHSLVNVNNNYHANNNGNLSFRYATQNENTLKESRFVFSMIQEAPGALGQQALHAEIAVQNTSERAQIRFALGIQLLAVVFNYIYLYQQTIWFIY